MNKAGARALRAHLTARLSESDLYKFEVGGIRYDSAGATVKVRVSEVHADGSFETKQHLDYRHRCEEFGLHLEWLDTVFTYGGQIYVITGLTPGRHKYPVNAVDGNGNPYKFPVHLVADAKLHQALVTDSNGQTETTGAAEEVPT